MKKLILLLTSLLLASGANSAVVEFENVNTSHNAIEHIQVAHVCGIGRVHVGHAIVGKDSAIESLWSKNHVDGIAQCAKKDWIWHCVNQNKPLDTSRGGRTCLAKCDNGWKVDTSDNLRYVYRCVKSDCPANHTWQGVHQKCISFTELNNFCGTQNMIYDSKLDYCRIRCPANHSFQAAHKRCLPFTDLGKYCKGKGKVYDPTTDNCEQACPNGKTLSDLAHDYRHSPELHDGVCTGRR